MGILRVFGEDFGDTASPGCLVILLQRRELCGPTPPELSVWEPLVHTSGSVLRCFGKPGTPMRKILVCIGMLPCLVS